MEGSDLGSGLSRILAAFVQYLTSGQLVLALRNIAEVVELAGRFRDRLSYHGIYEILEYDSTLEILDTKGKRACLTRRERIRFLQNNVIGIHDHAWGHGELFAEYHCRPGIAVDFYEDGARHNVLISLRRTMNRGDVIDLWTKRVILGGLLKPPWWLETDVDHLTRNLKLSIIFPQERLCRQAAVTRKSTQRTTSLGAQHFSFLRDGRQQLTWKTGRPKLHDLYTIKWMW